MKHVDDSLLADPEVVLAAMGENTPEVFEHAAVSIVEDKKLVSRAMKFHREAVSGSKLSAQKSAKLADL